MSSVRIPPMLRTHTGGIRQIEAPGDTVAEVLKHVADQYPSLRSQLFDGADLHRYVNVYLNDQDIQYLDKLSTPTSDTDSIIILPAMAGG